MSHDAKTSFHHGRHMLAAPTDRGKHVTTNRESDARATPPVDRTARLLTVAAVASLSAGAIHAAAIGSYSAWPRAAEMFTVVALFQLGWGALALVRRTKGVAIVGLVGLVGNAILLGGWVLARSKGLSFIDGLEKVERIQVADALSAALAGFAALTAATVVFGLRAPRIRPFLAGGAVAALGLAALPGMIEAGKHVHEDGGVPAVVVVRGKTTVVKVSQPVPPKPFDPKSPIDLGGVKGVSQVQQARAENLVAETVVRLPQWSNPATAEAAGFKSIGDGITGLRTSSTGPSSATRRSSTRTLPSRSCTGWRTASAHCSRRCSCSGLAQV
jgi:hypothetical protein